VSVTGQLAPPPQRSVTEPAIQAIVASIQRADYDLKATTGLFEPSLGERKSDQSGRAILALQQQGDKATSNYFDNLGRSIRAVGGILVRMIPKVYAEARVRRILGADEKERAVMTFAGPEENPNLEQPPDKVEGIYDLGVGRYDVRIAVGPSHESKRKETAEMLSTFVQAYPNAFPILGDLILGNMDWPQAQEAAKRLARLVPPQAMDQPGEEGETALPPQIQAQMQALHQQLQQAVQQLQQAHAIIQGKQQELAAHAAIKREELASKERIEAMKGHIALIQAQAKIEHEQATTKLTAEIERVQALMDQLHERSMAQEAREAGRLDQILDAAGQAASSVLEGAGEEPRADAGA